VKVVGESGEGRRRRSAAAVTDRLEFAAVKKLCSAALVASLVLACGKRGDPKPPVPVIPKATSDLVVTQRGPKVILSWSYPSLTTAGQSLGGARRVVVYRYVEELPAPAQGRDPNTILPGDIDPTAPRAVSLFARVPVIGVPQFIKLRQKVDSIEDANLATATAGARLAFEDTPSFQTNDGRPVRLTYAVVTETTATRSDISNLATIVPVDVPVAPASLTAAAKPQGVVLTWTRPEASVTGAAKPFLVGYNVYRTPEGSDAAPTPVNPAPVTTTTYTDVPPYGAYTYSVSAVATTGAPSIESDPSTTATATFKDLLPPAPPTGVTALVETNAVRLVWDAVDTPDLAGYLVYRTEGKAKLKLSPGPVTAPFFRDISTDRGISYFYSITSIDKNGNESAPANSGNVLVPKTP
jgi:hypothetical protein